MTKRKTAAKKPIRVALFSGNYNCVRDGANNALNRLVAHLLSLGIAVRVYSPTIDEPAFAPAGDLVSVPSIPIPGRSEYRFAKGLDAALRQDIADFAPTIFHLSAPDFLGFSAKAYARELGIPAVASLHTRFEAYLDFYRLGFFKPMIERRLDRFYREADAVLVPTLPILAEFREKALNPNLFVWSRGVDEQAFSPANRSLEWRHANGWGDDEAVLLFFGRLVKEKGTAEFAAVIEKLRARGHKIRPLLVGAGPEHERLAEALGDAHFTGHLDANALQTAVASADILINPSVTEAFGNVNLEAMTAGVVVVAPRTGSVEALVEDGVNGLLVPAHDIDAYVAAVEVLLGDPGKRRALSEAALQLSAQYRWPAILDGVVDSYREVIARRRTK